MAEVSGLKTDVSVFKAQITKKVDTLEAKVDSLQGDRLADRDKAEDSNDEIAQLRLAVSELRRDMVGVRESVDRVGRDLKAHAVDPINTLRAELQAAQGDAASLRAQVSVLSTQLATVQQDTPLP